ncbi:MAG: FAD/NAD(P)-binding protein [Phycisphaerae bacterium]|nr:FAD/NAD(P)-binding protein [Phycisphaerae bacterium]
MKPPEHHSPSTTPPSSFARLWTDRLPASVDLAIVGGGFSGLLALIHTLRLRPNTRVAVIEQAPRRGPGPAYGACDAAHLLNVPASRMGALPDDPGAFYTWLERRVPDAFSAGDFVARALYGEYLIDLLNEQVQGRRERVEFVQSTVTRIDPRPDDVAIDTADGSRCIAGAVILAVGIPPGPPPWSALPSAHDERAKSSALVADPWLPNALDGVPRDDAVLIIGSGLTAIDVVVAIRERGHRGHITLVSRNGRLPLPHAADGAAPVEVPTTTFSGGPRQVLRQLRKLARDRVEAGHPWQSVIDAIRPRTATIWRSWSSAERRRFLRALRPFWEVHRHRAPTSTLALLNHLTSCGQVTLVRGQLASVRAMDGGRIRVTLQSVRDDIAPLVVARVFNCAGPPASVHASTDPLIERLLATGVATSDCEELGLCADDDGRLIGTSGVPNPRVVVIGSLRRGELWESIAVPELRLQALRAAQVLATIR